MLSNWLNKLVQSYYQFIELIGIHNIEKSKGSSPSIMTWRLDRDGYNLQLNADAKLNSFLGSHAVQTPAKVMLLFLFSVAFVYNVTLWVGFIHYINFFPSTQWTIISVALSLVLAYFIVPSVNAIDILVSPNSSITFSGTNTFKIKKTFVSGVGVLLISYCFFNLLAFGLGPAVTFFYSTSIDKDIVGTKTYSHRSKSADDYYIDTSDLPEGFVAKFYISKKEFELFPLNICMHLTLKQSFFGLSVERYVFIERLK